MKGLIIKIVAFFILTVCVVNAGEIKGTVTARGARNAANTVVYIEKIEGKTYSPPEKHAIMDQKNLTFTPHILPVVKGTTVDFMNSDDVLHNVFTPDKCAEKFNLGTWPKGEVRSYQFNNAGCVSVMLCNVHPEMEAYVFVLDTPFYAVTAKDGSYSIKDLPPGKYTLKIWHKKLKSKPVEVTVTAEGSVIQDFTIRR